MLKTKGIYLIDNGDDIFINVWKEATDDKIMAIFGENSYDQLTSPKFINSLDTEFGFIVMRIINWLREIKTGSI